MYTETKYRNLTMIGLNQAQSKRDSCKAIQCHYLKYIRKDGKDMGIKVDGY